MLNGAVLLKTYVTKVAWSGVIVIMLWSAGAVLNLTMPVEVADDDDGVTAVVVGGRSGHGRWE